MYRLADLRALNAARYEAAYRAGQKAAFGAAAVVATVAVGSSAFEQFGTPLIAPEPLLTPNSDDTSGVEFNDALLTVAQPSVDDVLPHMGGPLESVEPASYDPGDDLPIVTDPLRLLVTDGVDGDDGVTSIAFVDDVLKLDQREPYVETQAGPVEIPLEPGALEALADTLGADYQAADISTRDISLFLAADDEAISWSLTQASPNYGQVAYEDERVDVGNLAVGVALNLENARIAAAYVEREVDTRMNARFGEASREQNFVGAIVTLKM